MVGHQLDDSQSLHRKWLEITKHPLKTGCLGYQVEMKHLEIASRRKNLIDRCDVSIFFNIIQSKERHGIFSGNEYTKSLNIHISNQPGRPFC